MNLSNYANAILKNVGEGGLERYDPNDLDQHIYEKYGVFKNNLYRKTLRGAGIFFPMASRKLLHLPKTINATTYYHLGMAYLLNESHDLGFQTPATAQEMAEKAIAAYYQADSGLWLNPSGWVPVQSDSILEKEGPRSMAMHCVARLNILLLELWRKYGREDFLEIAAHSATAVHHYHNILNLGDGMASISYYDNSLDHTLNVNSEYLEWVTALPAGQRPAELDELGHKILRMLLHEQNEDGSFYYLGKAYMETHRCPSFIDNHHTAYTLKNLLQTLDCGFPDREEAEILASGLVRGMEFYLDRLYQPDGTALPSLAHSGRTASAVPYSEGIVTFCTYLRSPSIPESLKGRIREFLPKIMAQLLPHIRLKDGSVPTEYMYGRTIRHDSIRWGNGPALQAIFEYMSAGKEGLLNA